MKKILFGLFLSLGICLNSFAADYYLVGVDAFKKGAYDKATANLEHAVRISPKNVNARYYLAQSYLMQKRVSDAQTQYERIILLAPDSDAGVLSYKGISLIKSSAPKEKAQIANLGDLSNYKDNYYDYILSENGKPTKWGAFPLTVYIQPNGKKDAVKAAFNKWQSKCKNIVNFKFQDSPKNAQILVDFKDQLESTSTEKSFIAGYSKPYTRNGKMSKSEIHLLSLDPATKVPRTSDEILGTALHEIGHSLGINGHSPNENDVMFASSDKPKLELTQRDMNTIFMLYSVNDTALATRNIGSKDLRLQQALDYVKNTPNKSVGWVNLADIYRQKKMYKEAILNYQKASEIEPDKADIYSYAGTTYIQMGDTESAYTNFKKACDLDNKNSNYILSFAKICLQTGRKDVGMQYVHRYFKANPEGANDENLQKILMYYN